MLALALAELIHAPVLPLKVPLRRRSSSRQPAGASTLASRDRAHLPPVACNRSLVPNIRVHVRPCKATLPGHGRFGIVTRETARTSRSAVLADARATEIGRVEELPLQLGAGTRDDAGADLGLTLQRAGDRAQEGIVQIGIERARGSHHGAQLVV